MASHKDVKFWVGPLFKLRHNQCFSGDAAWVDAFPREGICVKCFGHPGRCGIAREGGKCLWVAVIGMCCSFGFAVSDQVSPIGCFDVGCVAAACGVAGDRGVATARGVVAARGGTGIRLVYSRCIAGGFFSARFPFVQRQPKNVRGGVEDSGRGVGLAGGE